MRKQGAIGLLLLGAVPGSAAAAPVVQPVSVSQSVTVPSGAVRTLTLTCPGTAVALSGAASSERGTDSIPNGDPQRWSFRFASAAGDPRRRVVARLRCVGLRVPNGVEDVRLVVSTLRRPNVSVGANSTTRVELACEPGHVPTGWGLQRVRGEIAVGAVRPTRRGFVFVLENPGDQAGAATPRIRCLDRTQRAAGGETHSFATRVATFRDSGPAARHSCRQREYSVSAGASLDVAGDVFLTRAMPTGERGALWRFSAGGPSTTSLICLARGSRFR